MPIIEVVKFHGPDDECLLTSHNELQCHFEKMFTLRYCPHHYTIYGVQCHLLFEVKHCYNIKFLMLIFTSC